MMKGWLSGIKTYALDAASAPDTVVVTVSVSEHYVYLPLVLRGF